VLTAAPKPALRAEASGLVAISGSFFTFWKMFDTTARLSTDRMAYMRATNTCQARVEAAATAAADTQHGEIGSIRGNFGLVNAEFEVAMLHHCCAYDLYSIIEVVVYQAARQTKHPGPPVPL